MKRLLNNRFWSTSLVLLFFLTLYHQTGRAVEYASKIRCYVIVDDFVANQIVVSDKNKVVGGTATLSPYREVVKPVEMERFLYYLAKIEIPAAGFQELYMALGTASGSWPAKTNPESEEDPTEAVTAETTVSKRVMPQKGFMAALSDETLKASMVCQDNGSN